MKYRDSLLVEWEKTLARRGDSPAIFDTSGAIRRTFQQIEAETAEFETELKNYEPGALLAVQIGNRPEWPALLLACLRHRVVVLPLEKSISRLDRDAALKICNAQGVVEAAVPGRHSVNILPLKAAVRADWNSTPPSLLKLTSGTTAEPRAICFQSAQLLADCENICDTMGISEADVNFGVIPISHSYGFSNLLTPLIARGVSLALSSDRLPRAVLADLARTKATVFPGMPIFYQAFSEMDAPALPKLRTCISAGAPLTAAVAQRFHEKFGLPIHSFYGSSECGGICYDRDGTVFEDGFVGTAMNGVEIEMTDASTDSSQIRVRSAAVGEGYFPETDEKKLGRGIFRPDDLLARHRSGFKVVGRTSDVINVAGKKVSPAEVETELLRIKGVRQAVVFGRKSARRNEEVAACVVAEAGILESTLLEFCRGRLSGWQVPKRIFLVDQIPVNERGKTSRRDLALRFAEK